MVQGSDTGHGACSDLTYSCAPDPSNIYLFITDKTSQGIKLLLQASEVASDISSWSCRCPMIHWHRVTVAMATCSLMKTTGKTRGGADYKERNKSAYVKSCAIMGTLQLDCAGVFKSTIICTAKSFSKEQNLSIFTFF